MKFHLDQILIWHKDGSIRVVDFLPNKVNVITGDSHTGKTTILEILDYCLFASKSKISESIINENADWYGVAFSVNGKRFTIARKSLNKGKVSKEYYFSSEGEVPAVPQENNSEESLKTLIESEFSIDLNVKFPYGGNIIKPGSKISFRYFLLFNTLSGNIIENDRGVFFDKQDESRYREALPRIFDLAVGIETIENILKREKKSELEKELQRFSKKKSALTQQSSLFREELDAIIKRAKELQLVDSELKAPEALAVLHELIAGTRGQEDTIVKSNFDQLQKSKRDFKRKIQNLQSFKSEYGVYKNNLEKSADSLLPVEFLLNHTKQLIKTESLSTMLSDLESELNDIKQTVRTRTPIERQVNDLIVHYNSEISKINEILRIEPKTFASLGSEKEKIFFLGELKAKLELYTRDVSEGGSLYEIQVSELQEKINNIEVEDVLEKKELTVKLIEEVINDYIADVGVALGNYAQYLAVFDYKNKSLSLRKPKTSFVENVGSSSNHMFLHLFMMLGIHEVAFCNQSPFVAPFLIIDQPSRPYWGGEGKNRKLIQSDEYKIKEAFKLLNDFIQNRIKNEGNFQMIVFEHVPPRIWDGLDEVHLVEEFRDDNALVNFSTDK